MSPDPTPPRMLSQEEIAELRKHWRTLCADRHSFDATVARNRLDENMDAILAAAERVGEANGICFRIGMRCLRVRPDDTPGEWYFTATEIQDGGSIVYQEGRLLLSEDALRKTLRWMLGEEDWKARAEAAERRAGEAERARDYFSGYQGDLAAITACMDRLDYPHPPENPDRNDTIGCLNEMWGEFHTMKDRAEAAERRAGVAEERMRAAESRAREAEEIAAYRQESMDLLAREMIYRGNSVGHWWAKAMAYKDAFRLRDEAVARAEAAEQRVQGLVEVREMHGATEFLGVFTRDEYIGYCISGLIRAVFPFSEEWVEKRRRDAADEWDRARPKLWRETP